MWLARDATGKLSSFTLSSSKPSRPSRSAPRGKYHHGDLRNALIAAALELIAEHGVEGFTLRDCARKAGVSVAAPYRHFQDRDDLLASVAADCMARIGDAMERAVEAAGTDDPLLAFRATGIAYVRFAVEHPAHFRVMNMPQVVARTPPEMREQVDAWTRAMSGRLAAAQAAGQLVALPLDDILLAAGCITHGLAHMITDGVGGLDEIDPDRAAQLATAVTAVLGLGLLPRTGVDAETTVATATATTPARSRRKRGRGGAALVLAGLALGAGRADAKPRPRQLPLTLAWRADYTPSVHGAAPFPHGTPEVLVDDWPTKPPAGTYLLVGTRGPVGVVAIDATPNINDDCRYQIDGHLVDAPAWSSTQVEHYVVIGPVDPDVVRAAPAGSPRLMRLGLATAGRSASEPDEPLGVAPPPDGVTYAIDLDGDGQADLATEETTDHGRFVRGVATVKSSARVWQRVGKRWSSIARCRWKGYDTIR
jgi:AcrR family transcriptional regulator